MPDRLRICTLKKEHDGTGSSGHVLGDDHTVDQPFPQWVGKQNSIQEDGDRDVRERVCHHSEWTGNDAQLECL